MYAVPKSVAGAAHISSDCLSTLLLQRSGRAGDFYSFDVEAYSLVVAPSNSYSSISPAFSTTLKQKIFKTVSLLLAGISSVRTFRAALKCLFTCPAGFFQFVA